MLSFFPPLLLTANENLQNSALCHYQQWYTYIPSCLIYRGRESNWSDCGVQWIFCRSPVMQFLALCCTYCYILLQVSTMWRRRGGGQRRWRTEASCFHYYINPRMLPSPTDRLGPHLKMRTNLMHSWLPWWLGWWGLCRHGIYEVVLLHVLCDTGHRQLYLRHCSHFGTFIHVFLMPHGVLESHVKNSVRIGKFQHGD